ncbi:MAG TPA: nitroreductase family protein [Spirochaetota bacterium]|nr:nitroreductase family protein [Spirochaetota bacterium]HOD13801.1 nitroreductase family protein [Spirochaetota bacterium]HPG50962.1 nitroreductase family protein [Spirochaetota bacterium]HPN11583.1 nitroreductase family protein [Spirochaetota bacterium]HQL81476.1 nitroreductase family protein [Spirochaetota bacterium]
MNYDELLKNRRSVRMYTDRMVNTGVLKDIIRESTLAPSSGNSQPWKFVIVNDRAMMKRVSDESKKNLVARIEANPADYIKRYEQALRNEEYNVFYNAPALIILAGPRDYRNLLIDCALCAAYIMNASVSRGLGTCWVNLGSDIRDQALLGELGITPDLAIVAPIILGYPRDIPAAPKREEPVILKVIEGR